MQWHQHTGSHGGVLAVNICSFPQVSPSGPGGSTSTCTSNIASPCWHMKADQAQEAGKGWAAAAIINPLPRSNLSSYLPCHHPVASTCVPFLPLPPSPSSVLLMWWASSVWHYMNLATCHFWQRMALGKPFFSITRYNSENLPYRVVLK